MISTHLEQNRSDKVSGRAIVIGGSIAGLLSARVLAEKFTSVTIVERDILPEQPTIRKGVPQSIQPHTFLVKGYRLLEESFPGIGLKLTEAGALKIDWAREFHLFDKVGWRANAQDPSDIISFTCSRSLLEWVIREELSKFKNVHFIQGYRVTGLKYNSTSNRINGVLIRSNNHTVSEELLATLVVDASGRSSNAPEWLTDAGLNRPPETVVNPFLGYVTRVYKEPKGFQADWKIMLISASAPDCTRLGYLARIEDGKWVATLGGYNYDFPSTDNEGFLNFARSLPSSKFYQAIIQAEPVSPTYAYRATANRLRHYEKINMPQGFIALGDAVCALCPVYGQGITVSALAAKTLKEQLQDASSEEICANSFQKKLAAVNLFHWSLATNLDSQFPKTIKNSELNIYTNAKVKKKKPGVIGQILSWYIKRFMYKTTKDSSLNTLWLETVNLIKKPTVFFHPSVIFKVIW